MASSPLDFAVLAVYLVGVVAFGLWIGRDQKGAADYMLGDRNIAWWGLLFSIVATETSTVTFLSIPGFAWSRDFTFIQLPLGYLIGRFLVVAVLLPHYFSGEYFTAYEVLRKRFGGAVGQAASFLFIVTRSLADGLRLFLTAIVVQEMAGLSLPVSVALVGVTTIVYTFAGGMKAVVWTDVAQFFIYNVGAVVAFFLLLGQLPGGWGQLVAEASAAGKFRWLDLSTALDSPYTLWAGLIGGMFLTIGSHGADQMMVQRYLCARSQREAGRAVWMSGVVVFLQFALFLLIGVGLYVFYQAFPPAVAFDRPDRVFVRFIVEQLPRGMVGLVIGAIFAAAMSTLSGSLNSSATAAVTDFYRPLVRPDASSTAPAARDPGLHAGVRPRPDRGGPRRTAAEPDGRRVGAHDRGVHDRHHPRRLLPGDLHAAGGNAGGIRRSPARPGDHHGGGLRHDARLAVVHARGLALDARLRPAGEPGVAGAAAMSGA